MKQLLLLTFFSLLLVASCKCNNDADKMDETTDTTATTDVTTDGTTTTDGATTGTTYSLSEEDFRRMYNVDGYSNDEVRRFRQMHDEMDWGTVPGFYPEGSTRPLNESDTRYLTKWGHKVMLNEIYARHGMTFTDDDLKSHFGRFEWYNPRSANVQSDLTELEKQNIEFLNNHQPTTM
jgi:hypothetical protein